MYGGVTLITLSEWTPPTFRETQAEVESVQPSLEERAEGEEELFPTLAVGLLDIELNSPGLLIAPSPESLSAQPHPLMHLECPRIPQTCGVVGMFETETVGAERAGGDTER